MKKYRVTEKHGILKDCIIFLFKDCYTVKQTGAVYFSSETIDDVERWKKLGWIEEIQEPKWTDKDMIYFANEVCIRNKDETIHDIFRKFKKSKDEKDN